MTSVCGFDLSSKAVDIVCLGEETNRAEWVRVELPGADAWTRTLALADLMPGPSWYDDRGVYLAAIEKPVNDQQRVLMRVQGAILASLPASLRQPHCCWEVHPSTWKAGLGLKAKPTASDVIVLAGYDLFPPSDEHLIAAVAPSFCHDQNARDAYCLALYARDENARAVAAALGDTA